MPVPGGYGWAHSVTRLLISSLQVVDSTIIMSTEVAVPDVVSMDLRGPIPMSSISFNAPITPHHSMGCPPRSPPKVRLDDSSIHAGSHEDLPHVSARLDARLAFLIQTLAQLIVPHVAPCVS